MTHGRTKRTPHARDKFLLMLAESCNVTESARAADLSRRTVYEWRDEDTKFAKEWEDALAQGIDKLEREAWRRAHEGFDEPVFHQGIIVGRVRKYSDRLMEILLKGHRPEKYRERLSAELTGANGGPISVANMTDDALNAKLAALVSKAVANADTPD